MTDNLLNKLMPAIVVDTMHAAPNDARDAGHDASNGAYNDTQNDVTGDAQNGAAVQSLSDAERARILRLLGVPESPDDYAITLKNDHVEIDPVLNARLHQKGFTCAQVQEVYDLACEKLVPLILEMAAEFEAERESERLCNHFGGAPQFQEIAHQLRDFGRRNLPDAAYNGLCCSYDGVMALYHMMMQNGRSGAPVMRGGSSSDAAHDEVSLRKMMQDPRYWRDRDPGFIAKVTAGYDRLYQSQGN